MKEHKATIGNPNNGPNIKQNVLETWKPIRIVHGMFINSRVFCTSQHFFAHFWDDIPGDSESQVRRRQLRRGWNAPMGHGLSDVIQGWHQGLQPVCWASLLVCLKMVWFYHPKSSGLTWSINVNHIISSIEVAILGDFGTFFPGVYHIFPVVVSTSAPSPQPPSERNVNNTTTRNKDSTSIAILILYWDITHYNTLQLYIYIYIYIWMWLFDDFGDIAMEVSLWWG